MSVGRFCSREVDTALPDESAQQAAERMHARKVGTLVVVNAAGEPLGLVTDRDLAVRVVGEGRSPAQTAVRDVMTTGVVVIDVNASLEDALRSMRAHQCRRIPVVEGAGKLVGLLSLDDILDLLADEFQLIGGLIRKESPRSLAEE